MSSEVVVPVLSAVVASFGTWLSIFLKNRRATSANETEGRIAEWQAIAANFRKQIADLSGKLDEREEEVDRLRREVDELRGLVRKHEALEVTHKGEIARLTGDQARLQAQLDEFSEILAEYRPKKNVGREKVPTEPTQLMSDEH